MPIESHPKLVTAAVIMKDGKFLIGKRKANRPLGNKWEFPGGKVELNETAREALQRELHEELGVGAIVGKFICSIEHVYSQMRIELLLYEANLLSEEFKLSDHEEIRWVPPREMLAYDFVEADTPIVKKLSAGEILECKDSRFL